MKNVLKVLFALYLMTTQALANQQGALAYSKFHLESLGIGSSGPISVSGHRDAEGVFEEISVSFAGRIIFIPEEFRSKIPNHANGLQLNYLRFPDDQGGKTVLLVFQFGFAGVAEPMERLTFAVDEFGKVSIRCFEPGCGTSEDKSRESIVDPERSPGNFGFPPFSPLRSANVVEDSSLSNRCANLISGEATQMDIRYSVVTESKEWGRVWRADMYSNLTKLANRAVCWDPLDGPSDRVYFRAKLRDDTDGDLPG